MRWMRPLLTTLTGCAVVVGLSACSASTPTVTNYEQPVRTTDGLFAAAVACADAALPPEAISATGSDATTYIADLRTCVEHNFPEVTCTAGTVPDGPAEGSPTYFCRTDTSDRVDLWVVFTGWQYSPA